ncbi:MAG: hypothetical protein ACI8X5_003127 [Planctomycetota bacterium]|jgi:hypothetical protein
MLASKGQPTPVRQTRRRSTHHGHALVKECRSSIALPTLCETPKPENPRFHLVLDLSSDPPAFRFHFHFPSELVALVLLQRLPHNRRDR